MSIREIMIGNLVWKWSADKQYTMTVDADDFIDVDKIRAFEPVILSEEVLVRFGFVKSKMFGYDRHFEYRHPKLKNPVTAIYDTQFSINLEGNAFEIKTAHRLQNIFFAITQHELIWN